MVGNSFWTISALPGKFTSLGRRWEQYGKSRGVACECVVYLRTSVALSRACSMGMFVPVEPFPTMRLVGGQMGLLVDCYALRNKPNQPTCSGMAVCSCSTTQDVVGQNRTSSDNGAPPADTMWKISVTSGMSPRWLWFFMCVCCDFWFRLESECDLQHGVWNAVLLTRKFDPIAWWASVICSVGRGVFCRSVFDWGCRLEWPWRDLLVCS